MSDHSSLSTEDSWISLSSYQQHRETSFIPLNPKSGPKPISERILESNVRLESALSNVVSPNSEYQCLQGTALEREESASWIYLDRFWFDIIETIHLGHGDADVQLLSQGDVGQVDPVHNYSLDHSVPGKLTLQSDFKERQSAVHTQYISE